MFPSITFGSIAALCLLVLVPLVALVVRRQRTLSARQVWIQMGLRMSLVVLTTAALADPSIQTSKSASTLVVLLDRSAGVDGSIGRWYSDLEHLVEKEAEAEVRVLPFRTDPFPDGSEPLLGPSRAMSGVDLSSALALGAAEAARQPGAQLVLLTDGWGRLGDLDAATRSLNGTRFHVALPRLAGHSAGLQVRGAHVPHSVRLEERFDVELTLELAQPTELFVQVMLDGKEVARQSLSAPGGLSDHQMSVRVREEGFHRIAVLITPPDALTATDIVSDFVMVARRPSVLLLTDDSHTAAWVGSSLSPNAVGLEVRPTAPPPSSTELLSSDVIVLANVAADQLPVQLLRSIESAVREHGSGLLVFGGDRTFSRGAYQATPL